MANEFAKRLRKASTDAEKRLWYFLQNRQLLGQKFRRQHPIGIYVVDFYCAERKLVVELDGSQHAERADQDRRRTQVLESIGLHVMRFWDNDVLTNTEGVLEAIIQALSSSPSPQPSPRPGARE
jgi:very-short-patch-repair endonuclease